MVKVRFLIFALIAGCLSGCQSVSSPAAYGPTPSARQLEWHETQFYAFICLSSATYRDVEWGYGDMDPDEFQPIKFDPRQWVEVVKSAGMKGMVLTCKHHDGFCLWPSKLTDYSVAHSSIIYDLSGKKMINRRWSNGKWKKDIFILNRKKFLMK